MDVVLVLLLLIQLLPSLSSFSGIRAVHAATTGTKQKNPHIILLVVDDVGRADTDVYDDEQGSHPRTKSNIPTPNFKSLAKEGVLLDNFYTQTVCSPTRTALMTGRFPFRLGMQHVNTQLPLMAMGVPLETPMLPKLLVNYESHHVGKHHLGYATWGHTPMGRGFKSFFGYLQGELDYYSHKVEANMSLGHMEGFDLWDGREVVRHLQGKYTLDLYRERVHKIVHEYAQSHKTQKSREDNPLFLYYSHQTAHTPLASRTDEARCAGLPKTRRILCSMMVELDDSMGEFAQQLKDEDLWSNTLVFVMSDNGGMITFGKDKDGNLLPFASASSNSPLRGSKGTMFEGGVRNLAFVCGGAVPENVRGTRYKGLAHAVDFTASILSAAGVLTPKQKEDLKIDGINLLPALFQESSNTSPPVRDHVPINIFKGGKAYSAVRFGKYKVIVNDFALPVAQGWFDLNGELETPAPKEQQGQTLLFDVEADPLERKNIAAEFPNLVKQGLDLLESYVTSGEYSEPMLQTDLFPEGRPDLNNDVWMPFMSEEKWTQLWKADLAKQKEATMKPAQTCKEGTAKPGSDGTCSSPVAAA